MPRDDDNLNSNRRNRQGRPIVEPKEPAELEVISVNYDEVKRDIDRIMNYAKNQINNLSQYISNTNINLTQNHLTQVLNNYGFLINYGSGGGGGSKPPGGPTPALPAPNEDSGGSSGSNSQKSNFAVFSDAVKLFKGTVAEFSSAIKQNYHTIAMYQNLNYKSFADSMHSMSVDLLNSSAGVVTNMKEVTQQYSDMSAQGLKDQKAQSAALVQATSDAVFGIKLGSEDLAASLQGLSQEQGEQFQKAISVIGGEYQQQTGISTDSINAIAGLTSTIERGYGAQYSLDFYNTVLDRMGVMVDNGMKQSDALGILRAQAEAQDNPYEALMSGNIFQMYSALGMDTQQLYDMAGAASSPLARSALGSTLGIPGGGSLSVVNNLPGSGQTSGVNTITDLNQANAAYEQAVGQRQGTLSVTDRLKNLFGNTIFTGASQFGSFSTAAALDTDILTQAVSDIAHDVGQINDRQKSGIIADAMKKLGGGSSLTDIGGATLSKVGSALSSSLLPVIGGAVALGATASDYSKYSNDIENSLGVNSISGTGMATAGLVSALTSSQSGVAGMASNTAKYAGVGLMLGGPLGAAIGGALGLAVQASIDPEVIADRLAYAEDLRNNKDKKEEYLKNISEYTKMSAEIAKTNEGKGVSGDYYNTQKSTNYYMQGRVLSGVGGVGFYDSSKSYADNLVDIANNNGFVKK